MDLWSPDGVQVDLWSPCGVHMESVGECKVQSFITVHRVGPVLGCHIVVMVAMGLRPGHCVAFYYKYL